MWIMVGFVSWGNTYIEGMGFSKAQGSMIMMIYGLAGIVASPLGGILAQKAPSPKLLFAALFITLALGTWFFGSSESLLMLGILSAVVGFALGLANPLLPYLTSCFAGKGLTATAGGVTGCIYQMGAIVAPWLMGLSLDLSGSFSSVWVLMVVGSALGVVCLIPMGKPQRG
jgi:predicted MFS family arabinose efflux permease